MSANLENKALLSRVEKGKLNIQNYDGYVERLRSTGQKFPINNFGDVNLSAVAKECGFLRQVFSTNKNMGAKLIIDVKAIGTDLVQGKAAETVMDQNVTLLKKQLNNSRKDLALAEETIDALKKQILYLETENKHLKHQSTEKNESFEYMIETGRRFTL
ncbi:MAG: hypothetical protein ACI88H_001389 [Cocleimonas sp.]|jgi:hypothetical protein